MTGPEPASDALIGQRLSHFRVDAKLGEGGMGVVYRATDERLRREVALKVLPDALASDPERRRRFLREARAAAAVTHPNIAAVYDIGEVDGRAFIAMELIQGDALRARMEPGLTHAEALRIAREIAKGLAQAHESGIVHRDLKPENVMITRDGGVKILDFGLAKLREVEPSPRDAAAGDQNTTSQMTGMGRVMGTPAYMSPEQADGEAEVGAPSDVFSFGTMLYELLSGVRPFRGATTIGVLYSVLHREPEPLGSVCPELTSIAAAVVARCLRKSPADRYASGRELLAALERVAPIPLDQASGRALPAAGPSAASGTAATSAANAPVARPGTPDHENAKLRRAVWTFALGALIALIALCAVGWRVVRLKPPGPAGEPSAGASSGPSGPVPCNAEGARLFEEGVEKWEARSQQVANAVWDRAVKADPDCGPAYLRLALGIQINGLPMPTARAYLADARAHGDHLTVRQAALLDAIAPYFAVEADDAAAYENLRALTLRFPDDPITCFYYAYAAYGQHRKAEAQAAYQRALTIQPRFGPAYAQLAYLADGEDARLRYLQQCRDAVPRHVWCDDVHGETLQAGSDCAAFERFGREAVARNPGFFAQGWLLTGLAASGAPAGALDEALRQVLEKASSELAGSVRLPTWEAVYNRSVALAEGDFARAERTLATDPAAGSGGFNERAAWTGMLAVLLDDTGRGREADDLVRQSVLSGRALAPAKDPTEVAEFYARAVAAGALTRPEVDAAFGPAPATGEAVAAWSSWVRRQLRLAGTPDEARNALASMPARAALVDAVWDESEGKVDYEIARVRALAGDFKGAQRDAESAIARCDVLHWPALRPRAFLLLGEASERTGDLERARTAYETVVKRWGDLKPKAVLADRARARLSALAAH